MALHYRDAKDCDQRSDAAIEVAQWARDILNADSETVVRVTRPHCGEPDCAEDVTTILFMRPDKPTSMVKIMKSLKTVTKADLRAALLPVVPSPQQVSQREP
jgi:hypothetical protein